MADLVQQQNSDDYLVQECLPIFNTLVEKETDFYIPVNILDFIFRSSYHDKIGAYINDNKIKISFQNNISGRIAFYFSNNEANKKDEENYNINIKLNEKEFKYVQQHGAFKDGSKFFDEVNKNHIGILLSPRWYYGESKDTLMYGDIGSKICYIKGGFLCKFSEDSTIEILRYKEYDEEKMKHYIREEKRDDYISWDQYFIGVAALSAHRSKDPKTQVGACIVRDNKILSVGYNGFPNGISDDKFPWSSESAKLENRKDAYVVHAELNAILNSNVNLQGATIYVTLHPCNECAKAIIQAGIKKVYFRFAKYSEKEDIADRMFKEAEVEIEKVNLPFKQITI